MMNTAIVHFVGPDIRIDDKRMRQRCAWCGTLLLEYDLDRIQVPVGQRQGMARFEVGTLLEVYEGMRQLISHKPGDKLPPNTCAELDDEVTR
jgi:hypothetical protein